MSLDYGLRVSQPGYDVKTATDSQCVFTSKNNTLKIAFTGVVSITVPSGTGSGSAYNVTFTHNLGFVPGVLVNPNDGGTSGSIGLDYLAPPVSCPGIAIDNIKTDYDITSTTLKCYATTWNICAGVGTLFWPQGSDKTINFKYFIFTQQVG